MNEHLQYHRKILPPFRHLLLLKIITDNGPAFLKALAYLEKYYHVKHIRISGYNSRANGLVEQWHFEVREAIFKACDGDESKWSSSAASVFCAERVITTTRHYIDNYGSYHMKGHILQKWRDQLANLQDRVYGM